MGEITEEVWAWRVRKAILTERKRCADIALTHMIRHQGPDGSAWAAADEIADAIRRGRP